MSYSLGVDLGATTCSVAVRRGPDIEPCAIGETETTMPAVALPRADGSMLVGEAADQRSRYEPTLAAREVSARLEEPGPIVLDGQTADPLSLTEALIGTAISRASASGEWPGHLVLTHPLRLGAPIEELLEQAASRVTTSEVMLVPEPIAAMAKLAHDVELAVGTTAAVIDFGGSSFDMTLVRRTETGFDLIGEPASLPEFGGFDVDNAVLAHVEDMLGHDVTARVDIADHDGMYALRRLRAACRRAKEELSSVHETVINVNLPDIQTRVSIARDDLERGIGSTLAEAVDLVLAVVADAGLTLSDVHVALVVGGSSRIPLLSQLITERIGLPIVADPLPELTVSLGAALFADEDPPDASPAVPAPLASPEPLMPPEPLASPTPLMPPAPVVPPDPEPVTVPPRRYSSRKSTRSSGASKHPRPPSRSPTSHGPTPARRCSTTASWAAGAGAVAGASAMAGADPLLPSGYMPPVENGPADPHLDYGVEPEGIGHPSDGADDAFRQLTTSDTDPFGTRSGSGALSGMAGRRGDQHDFDDEDRYDEPLEKKSPRDFGDSTDPRLIVGAIGAGLAIVLLGGFALAAGTGGGGNDDPAIAVTDPLSTVATTTTLSTSTTVEATTTLGAAHHQPARHDPAPDHDHPAHDDAVDRATYDHAVADHHPTTTTEATTTTTTTTARPPQP